LFLWYFDNLFSYNCLQLVQTAGPTGSVQVWPIRRLKLSSYERYFIWNWARINHLPIRVFRVFFFYAAVRKYIVSYTFEIIDVAYMNQWFPLFFKVGVERGLCESET
jgi:hypothetical protein